MDRKTELLSQVGAIIVEIILKGAWEDPIDFNCHTPWQLSEGSIKVPYGYRLRQAGDKPQILIQEKEAFFIRKIFTDFLTGKPTPVIHTEVKQLGFPRVGPNAIKKVLNNCFYAGLSRKYLADNGSGVLVRTFHPAVISIEDFRQAQQLLSANRTASMNHQESMPLKGVLQCPCGAKMTAGWHKGKRQLYLYYRCIKHSRVNLPGKRLHSQVDQLLKRMALTREQTDYVAQKALEIFRDTLREYLEIIKIKTQELQAISQTIAIVAKFPDHEIRLAIQWGELKGRLIEKGQLEVELSALNDIYTLLEGKAQRLIPDLCTISNLYDQSDHRQKQLLLKTIFKKGLIYAGDRFVTSNIDRTLHLTPQKQSQKRRI